MCLRNCVRMYQNEPITCYKVLIQNGAWYQRKKFTAPFRHEFTYVVGKTYKESEYTSYGEFYSILDSGFFHSFTTLGDAIEFTETFPKCYMSKHSKLVIVECKIPKESVCYEGNFSYFMSNRVRRSYASNAITIKRIINFNNK